MTGTVAAFWKRLSAVSLLSAEQLAKLQRDFDAMPAASTDGKWIAEQLVAGNVLSAYQARVLLGDGPVRFDYGPYRIINGYADGFRAGMYCAVHRPSRHVVDLDLVPPDQIQSRELEIHRQTHHANLADCHEFLAAAEDHVPVVLERVPGAPLAEVVRQKRLSVAAACRVVYQVAEAVAALHAVGLVHGQLCPAAVVVATPTLVKVLRRPGRRVDPVQAQDQPSGDLIQVCGDFQPPEATATPPIERAFTGDVYALGQILGYLIVGQTVGEVASLAAVPDPLRATIAAMIAHEPGERLSHASVVAALLADHATSSPTDGAEALTAGTANATWGPYSNYLEQQTAAAGLRFAATDAGSVSPLPAEAAAEVDFETERASQSATLRQRRRSERLRLWTWGALAALIAFVGIWVVFRSFRVSTVSEGDPAAAEATVETVADASVEATSGDVTIVTSATDEDDEYGADDGTSLWASPTTGDAIELRYAPPGAQLFVYLRPASLLSHAEGPRSFAALGPLFQERRAAWEATVGLPLTEMDALLLALVPRDARQPAAVWVVWPSAGKGVPSRWAEARQVHVDGQDLYVDAGRALWPVRPDESPASQSSAESTDQVFVIGTESAVRMAMEVDGAPSLLRRDLEQLRVSSDRAQHVTFLFAPNFLRAEGDKVFAPQLNELFSYIADYLGDETRGCLCSLHLEGNQFFGELRLVTDNPRGPAGSAERLRAEIEQMPNVMETAIAGLASLDPYWRRLALRSVRMTEFLRQHTRVGVEQRQVVANFSLPATAAHNLLLMIELTTAAVAAPPADEPARPREIILEDVLQTRLSLDIPQQSIEFALNDLAELVNARVNDAAFKLLIRIDGPSLQADGITRNQQIRGFRRDNATVADLLTGLVMTANPVTTVTAPHEPDQKLVWVILPEPAAVAGRIILITTRETAQQKGYSLPIAFQQK